jgi:hypothetical protein
VSEGYVEDAPQAYDGAAYLEQPIPVVTEVDTRAPEYGACMTWSIPQSGVGLPIQILTRRLRRYIAKIEINFTVAGIVTFNSNLDHLSAGQGYIVNVPVAGLYRFPDWESQQPLYCVASVAGLTVAVLDESYAER